MPQLLFQKELPHLPASVRLGHSRPFTDLGVIYHYMTISIQCFFPIMCCRECGNAVCQNQGRIQPGGNLPLFLHGQVSISPLEASGSVCIRRANLGSNSRHAGSRGRMS